LDPCGCWNGNPAITCEGSKPIFGSHIEEIILNGEVSGTFPSSFGQLTALTMITMCQNSHLTGTIPASFAQLTNLGQLVLANNQLTGTIPASFAQLTNLKQLVLIHNQLTGIIPALPFSQFDCELEGNDFSCPLPPGAKEHCNATCS
jgi:Leucine-rich repeat (LRR) protein